jgi:hypothetical protein
MEPTLHQGDLVLARPAAAYSVGQVVTYHHPQVGAVIHRIIARHGARYTLQGDANTWIDSYAPTGEEIIGRSWLVVRRGGHMLMTLRSPSGLAVMSILFAGLVALTVGVSTKGARNDLSEAGSRGTRPPARPPDGAVFGLGVLAIGSLLLAVAAFASPTTVAVPAESTYRQSGEFSYRAGAPATVYSGAALETGDPIFDSLVPTFTVAFDYQFASADPAQVHGTLALDLVVSEPNGWSRRLPLQRGAPFDGPRAHAEGVVDVQTVRRMISLLERATALDRDSYQVDVVADVTLDGTLAGRALSIAFDPTLPFVLDDYELYLRHGEPSEDGDADPTTTVSEGFLPYASLEPGALSILGLDIPVTTARAIAVAGLLLAVAIGAAVLVPYLRMRRQGEVARVLAEYDELLVSVREAPAAAGEAVEVRAFEDLARLAERSGRMILHAPSGPDHDFYLQDGGRTYHLRLSETPPPAEAEGNS